MSLRLLALLLILWLTPACSLTPLRCHPTLAFRPPTLQATGWDSVIDNVGMACTATWN
jgi:hypothetical protein